MSIANYFVIAARTNIIDWDGDHSRTTARFTTKDPVKAKSIFEDQCAKQEKVELKSYIDTPDSVGPELIDTKYGGLS